MTRLVLQAGGMGRRLALTPTPGGSALPAGGCRWRAVKPAGAAGGDLSVSPRADGTCLVVAPAGTAPGVHAVYGGVRLPQRADAEWTEARAEVEVRAFAPMPLASGVSLVEVVN